MYKNVKILIQMTWFEAKRFSMYPGEFVASIASRLIEITLYITFWLIVSNYSTNGSISPVQIVSYYLIINGVTSFFFTQLGVGSFIIRMVRYGDLNQALIKPINPILVPWSQRAGRNLLNLAIGVIQVIVGVAMAGSISLGSSKLLPFILFNTILLNIAFNIITGTFAFYFTEAGGVKNALVHIYNLMGGVLMPLFLMPASVAMYLQYTPFPAAQYHLAITLQGQYPVEAKYVAIGMLWSAILIIVALKFWKNSLAKYEAVGM